MTTEELLYPRFLVKVDYPDSPFKKGQIIQMTGKGRRVTFMQLDDDGQEDWETDFLETHDGGSVLYGIKAFTNYPDIFEPLRWWEERRPEDMPKYLESLETYPDHHFVEVKENYLTFFEGIKDGEYLEAPYMEYKPSTQQEYESYLQSKK